MASKKNKADAPIAPSSTIPKMATKVISNKSEIRTNRVVRVNKANSSQTGSKRSSKPGSLVTKGPVVLA